MANKAISELPQAQNVNNQDLFVLEQSGIAKKLPAETFITEQGIIDALAEALDGHGGISSVTLSSVSGRIRTYLITFTDGSATTFQVLDGTSIDRIVKTSTAGLVDTYTVFMNDGTTTFFTVTNGADGTVSEAMLNDALKDKAPAVTETTESSAIATFTDGADDMVMHNVIAEINPVQNLPYGDPYPAGSGKNKIDGQDITIIASTDKQIVVTDSTVTLAAGTYTLSFTVGANVTATRNRPLYLTGSTYTYAETDYKTQGRQSWTFTLSAETTLQFRWWGHTLSANCTISDFMLETGSSASSFAPYSNVCPITGWTGCNVTRTGKNILDISRFATEYPNCCTYSDGVLTVSGNIYPLYSTGISVNIPAGTTLNWTITNGTSVNARLRFLYSDNSALSITSPIPYTTPKDIIAVRMDWGTTGSFTVKNVQAELGSTATAYEPYQSNTVTVDWTTEAGTVYGGTIDVATGLLTVDRAYVDMGTMTWRKLTEEHGVNFFSNTIQDDIKASTGISIPQNIICSNYSTVSWSDFTLSTDFCIAQVSTQIRVRDSSLSSSDAAAFQTAMSGIQLVYELATPQTYQLTGQQLKTLLGTNNVWADTGDTSVTYPADTKMFIEKLTMPTEDDMTANQAITNGKFFMVGNTLYKATAAIANGATITPGTNATKLSLADALNLLNT